MTAATRDPDLRTAAMGPTLPAPATPSVRITVQSAQASSPDPALAVDRDRVSGDSDWPEAEPMATSDRYLTALKGVQARRRLLAGCPVRRRRQVRPSLGNGYTHGVGQSDCPPGRQLSWPSCPNGLAKSVSNNGYLRSKGAVAESRSGYP